MVGFQKDRVGGFCPGKSYHHLPRGIYLREIYGLHACEALWHFGFILHLLPVGFPAEYLICRTVLCERGGAKFVHTKLWGCATLFGGVHRKAVGDRPPSAACPRPLPFLTRLLQLDQSFGDFTAGRASAWAQG